MLLNIYLDEEFLEQNFESNIKDTLRPDSLFCTRCVLWIRHGILNPVPQYCDVKITYIRNLLNFLTILTDITKYFSA
jgi:hypothetical protein